jgi:hypothetical protein
MKWGIIRRRPVIDDFAESRRTQNTGISRRRERAPLCLRGHPPVLDGQPGRSAGGIVQQCLDCGRPFIFFADEQKHWYEDLGFGLYSNCVRCVPCRKRQQGIARQRERYEDLFHVPNRTAEETLEMADCCLSLIETGTFSSRQTERVRMLLNKIADTIDANVVTRCNEVRARLRSLEASSGEQGGALERR